MFIGLANSPRKNVMKEPNQPIQYLQYTSGEWKSIENGTAIVERSVSLTVNGELWLSFMCTPIELEALAVGFLFNEGFINSVNEIAQVHGCTAGNNVDVWLNHPIEKPTHWSRTTGCTGGMTGIENPESSALDSLNHNPSQAGNGTVITPQQVSILVERLFEAQDLYQQTGGVHTSALSDGKELIVIAEDIGRHNTLDKIAGKCLLENITLHHRILLSTGRISTEMLQKAARIGAVVVISRTAASAQAIDLADEFHITLIGYARRNRFNVYTNSTRIAQLSTDLSSSLANQAGSVEHTSDRKD
jgi:FdhD protein